MLNFFWESLKTGFSTWFGWVTVLSTIGSLVAFFMAKLFPKVTIPKLVYKIMAIIAILGIGVGFLGGTYETYNDKLVELNIKKNKLEELEERLKDKRSKNFATPDQLISPHLEGLDIRLADLVRQNRIIRNRTFVNCRIFGPAVVFPKKCVLVDNYFDDYLPRDKENITQDFFIPETGPNLNAGVIGMDNVNFRKCTFFEISFMGNESFRQKLLNSYSEQ